MTAWAASRFAKHDQDATPSGWPCRRHEECGGLLNSSYLSAPGGTEKRYDYHLDHLGTPRLITDAAGRKIFAHLAQWTDLSTKLAKAATYLQGTLGFNLRW
jgi:hypothetical protein